MLLSTPLYLPTVGLKTTYLDVFSVNFESLTARCDLCILHAALIYRLRTGYDHLKIKKYPEIKLAAEYDHE